eukprot:3658143-Rhodomonas_salina.2
MEFLVATKTPTCIPQIKTNEPQRRIANSVLSKCRSKCRYPPGNPGTKLGKKFLLPVGIPTGFSRLELLLSGTSTSRHPYLAPGTLYPGTRYT